MNKYDTNTNNTSMILTSIILTLINVFALLTSKKS